MSGKGSNMFNKKIIISMILILLSVSLTKGVTVSCGHSVGSGNYEFTNYDDGNVEVTINNGFSSIQILPENPFTLSQGESKVISLRSQYSDTYVRFFVMYKALYGAGFSASLECPFYATKSEHPVVTTTTTTTTTIPPECQKCVQWFRGTCIVWNNICDTTTTTVPETTTTQQSGATTTTIQTTTTTQPSTCKPTCRQLFRGMCISWNSCDTTTTTIPQTTTIPTTTTTIQGSTTTTLCQSRCVQWFRAQCIRWGC